MLIPKKVKHRKWHKGRARNIRHATDKVTLAFGSFGLKATTPAWVSGFTSVGSSEGGSPTGSASLARPKSRTLT